MIKQKFKTEKELKSWFYAFVKEKEPKVYYTAKRRGMLNQIIEELFPDELKQIRALKK